MTAVLLDTCAAIWLVEGLPLSQEARRRMIDAVVDEALYVSPVTGWEMGQMCARGRFTHAKTHRAVRQWMDALMARAGVQAAPFNAAIALDSTHLPDLKHRDPADRFLLATARHMNIPLVTRDGVLLGYAESGHVQCIPC
jgi:PIN domain nuclease of toxin-antitoxin system